MQRLLESRVEATVWLSNGYTWVGAWTTPVPFGRLLGKGGKWARQEVREAGLLTRGVHITAIMVTATRTGRPWRRDA